MIHSHFRALGADSRFRYGRLVVVLALIMTTMAARSAVCWGALHEGDRFSLRVGIWPQKAVSGSLGQTRITPGGTVYDAAIKQKSATAPFLELTGLFHLRNSWWAEGGFGWSSRSKVRVAGVPQDSMAYPLTLGLGRVDFFPLFAGIRAVHNLSDSRQAPKVYARAGLSIVFSSESPSAPVIDSLENTKATVVALDSLTKYGIYRPGTNAAFGFAIGVGGEVHYMKNFSLVADIQYRYVRFNYAQKAKFDLSGFWFSLGMALDTR